MTVRRQLLSFAGRNVDFRVGAGALDSFESMVRRAVGKPVRALMVSDGSIGEEREQYLERCLIDVGFSVEHCALEALATPATFEDIAHLTDAIGRAHITADDLVCAVGGMRTCSAAAFAARLWQGGTPCALVPVTLAAMALCPTSMQPLATVATSGMVSMRCEPSLVVCDLDLVRDAADDAVSEGLVEVVAAAMADSKRSWDRLGTQLEALASHDELALADALCMVQTARRSVMMAANPSARHALSYGRITAGALRACLGDAIPAWQLLAEGMRFEARLAVDACEFSVDDVFEQDDRLDDLGIPELPFELDPVRFIEAFRAQQALRSNRLLVALPRTPGTIRLAGVEDDVLERHAQAYTASRADLLSS